MSFIIGLLLIVAAGFLQGSFMLPMSFQKKWHWENGWLLFSLLGMIVLNWILAFVFIPGLNEVYSSCPSSKMLVMCLFGLGWGCGSVLFGIGMEKLGLSLGYPIIQGLTAMCGSVIPLLIMNPAEAISIKGLLLFAGAIIIVIGIAMCSKASSMKESSQTSASDRKKGGIIIAVAAGILSSFPNVGVSLGSGIIEDAVRLGTSPAMATNAVWALFFTLGFIPNLIYTVILFVRNHSFGNFGQSFLKNSGYGLLMSGMWIGSFYLYGIGANKMGDWGIVIGWPIYISLAIVVGNLWGIWRGEWNGADRSARKKLSAGMSVIIAAMLLIGFCDFI